MATNPRLDFYRFTLNHKKKDFATFTDFAIDELGAKKNVTDEKVVELCFEHFISSLDGEFAKDSRLKKQLTLIKKKSANKYLDKRPAFDSAEQIIYGVINGGPFGRDRIVSDIDDQNDSEVLGRNKSVLLYFYFLLYLPTDHNEGCFIIHSNGSDESITVLFRNFISQIFKGKDYNKAIPEAFCPESFQKEFRKGATIDSITFKTTFVENIPRSNPMANLLADYDIKIVATPRKSILATKAEDVKDFFSKKVFGSAKKNRQLDEFDQTKLVLESDINNNKKVFEWNTKDQEFVPVVYLENRITKKNADGTPDFDELAELCQNYFKDEVLPEIRPDKN